MLEQLFGSRTRWKLLKTFLSHPERKYYIRELTRTTGEKLNSVRRELANLEEMGVVVVEDPEPTEEVIASKKGTKKKTTKRPNPQAKKYYTADESFLLFNELKDLILKSWLLVEKSLVHKISKLGKVYLMLLSGRFIGNTELETDVLIIGNVNRDKLGTIMKSMARSFGEDIHYTVMSKKEYEYRKAVTDKFLYKVLESEHIKVIDELK